MKRFIVAFSLALAALAGFNGATLATNNIVTVSCSDATQFTATLDAGGTAQLADAVTAININPAGVTPLTCNLSQTALSGNAAQAASGNAFAAGGGKWTLGNCVPPANFSINAHDDGSGARGHFNLSIQEGACSGDLTAEVTCLSVSGNVAKVKATVQQSTGVFVGLTDLFVKATDDSPDKLLVNTAASCTDPSSAPGTAIERGNIVVHAE